MPPPTDQSEKDLQQRANSPQFHQEAGGVHGRVPLEDQVAFLSRTVAELRTRVADVASLLHVSTLKLNQTAERLARLEGVFTRDDAGNAIVQSGGNLQLIAGGNITIRGNGVKVEGAASMLEVSHQVLLESSRISMWAADMKFETSMASFTGVAKCETLIASTVVSSSYTPGAGNIW